MSSTATAKSTPPVTDSSTAAKVLIVVAAIALVVAGVLAVLAPDKSSVKTAGQPSWPCPVAAPQISSMMVNPPVQLTAATGTCAIAYGEAATTYPALAPSVITYQVRTQPGSFDKGQTQVTTWDGSTGVVTLAGKTAYYLRNQAGFSLYGASYESLGNFSQNLRDLTAAIKEGSAHVISVGFTKSNDNSVTWLIGLNEDRGTHYYQIEVDKSGRVVADAACDTPCTSTSNGAFETFAPSHTKVAVDPASVATTKLDDVRGVASSAIYSVQPLIRSGVAWSSALQQIVKFPSVSSPGPMPVEHLVAQVKVTSPNSAKVTVNSFGTAYTFTLTKSPRSQIVRASSPVVASALSADERNALAAAVGRQITARANTSLSTRGASGAVTEAIAGSSANNVVAPEPWAYADNYKVLTPDRFEVTLPVAGSLYRIVLTETGHQFTSGAPVEVQP